MVNMGLVHLCERTKLVAYKLISINIPDAPTCHSKLLLMESVKLITDFIKSLYKLIPTDYESICAVAYLTAVEMASMIEMYVDTLFNTCNAIMSKG